MATAINTIITATISSTLQKALDMSTPADGFTTPSAEQTTQFAFGAGAGQINWHWHDRRTVGAGLTDQIDVSGVLADAFGDLIVATKVKVIWVYNRETVAARLLQVGGDVSTFGLVNWVAAVGDAVQLGPTAKLLVCDPIDGYGVTAGTDDILELHNPGGADITYDIFLAGTA